MVVWAPRCLTTDGMAAPSPIHAWIEGRDWGVIWIVALVWVILGWCPSSLEIHRLTFSLIRRHISSVFRQFPSIIVQVCNLVAHHVGEERLLDSRTIDGQTRAQDTRSALGNMVE